MTDSAKLGMGIYCRSACLEELTVKFAGGQGRVDGSDGLHDQDVQAEGCARTAQYEGGDGESIDTKLFNQNIQVVISDWD